MKCTEKLENLAGFSVLLLLKYTFDLIFDINYFHISFSFTSANEVMFLLALVCIFDFLLCNSSLKVINRF